MARYTGPVCRICRREGDKLFLKGDRCYTDKCSVERRRYAPGQHGQNMRMKLSDYGVQLRAKQKVRKTYGVMERVFREYYRKADRMKGETGSILLQLLERRMDNVVYRLGFAPSRRMARQMVLHRHFLLNGKKAGIPSIMVKEGDEIQLKAPLRENPIVVNSMDSVQHRGVPGWLDLDAQNFKGRVQHLPARDEILVTAEEQLIVELYSK